MSVRNGVNSVTSTNEASKSKSREEKGKDSVVNGHLQETEKRDEGTNSVPFHRLFSFADSADVILMIIGTIGAIGNGLSMPLMTIFLGDMIDAFGENQNNKDLVHVVSKVKHVQNKL
ncbi:hypothetical protein P3X46_018170 [Hevea brasiliensis]|uniref:ABC transmembrane type-1 domain-containing protein n=1 Tax=Hevea brasiliensis TaxID=3981 RepID=A0ABQ9LTP6_HEVBR|nr:hypothetical protein P3X46_018170 [Hevea brasiliensis]